MLAIDVGRQTAFVLGAVLAKRAFKLRVLAALEAYVSDQRRFVIINVSAIIARETRFARRGRGGVSGDGGRGRGGRGVRRRRRWRRRRQW